LTYFLERAGRWFLESGIQRADGGVARYYRSDLQANAPVSNEITGYAVSTLAYLYERTEQVAYCNAALRAARFLTRSAWDTANATFPFEPGSNLGYFFDTGIIVRGLLAAYRISGDDEFRERAHQGALSLAFDFLGEGMFHPVIALPEKQPLPHEPRWSRSPGCYQLKSALAWHDLGDEHAVRLFEAVLAYSLGTHASFLDSEQDMEKVMDRLHAYCYFLEALLAVSGRPDVHDALAAGITRVARLLRETALRFERSDVWAQLLRVRLIAHHHGAVELDTRSAEEEAERVVAFQEVRETDLRLAGGFWFGSKGGQLLPYSNPVSTAFAMQGLALWQDHRKGEWSFTLAQLV
jgi:hypothetical protein